MRIRLDVAYDGTGFHGWAAQPGLRTVEGELSAALATVLRVPEVALTCAGRTDAGCTRAGRWCTPTSRSCPRGRAAGPAAQRRAGRRRAGAPGGGGAGRASTRGSRRSWRRYAYRVADRPELVDPLRRGHVLAWARPLDEALMNAAALALLGEHDFASFCKQREGATTIRTLLDLRWAREADGLLVAHVRADAFCHSMVRSLVGCLLAVGDGRRDVDWAAEVLAAGRRDSRGVGRAGARADPRGGRLPAGRRARRPGRDHEGAPWLSRRGPLLHRRPVGAVPAGAGAGVGVGPRARPGQRLGRLRPGPARHRHAVLFRETSPPAGGRILDLGCGYGVIGLAIAVRRPGRRGDRRRRQRAGGAAGQRERRRARAGRPVHRDAPRRRTARTRRTTSSGPTRRSGSARPRCTSCCSPGSPRLVPGGRAVMVVGQEPRRRLAPALAGGAGLPDRAGRQREGLPGAGEPAAVISPWEDPVLAGRGGRLGRRAAGRRWAASAPATSSSRTCGRGRRCSGCRPPTGRCGSRRTRRSCATRSRSSSGSPAGVPGAGAGAAGRDLDRGWMLMADAGSGCARWSSRGAQPGAVARRARGRGRPAPGPRAGRRRRWWPRACPTCGWPAWPTGTPSWCRSSTSSRGSATRSAGSRDLVDELASYGVAETLQHDDLHDGQVFVKDGRNLILDWGDAVVSHPFFTMSVTLEGGVAWGLDDVEDSEDIWPYVDSLPGALRAGPARAARRRAAGAAAGLGLPGAQQPRGERRGAHADAAADVPRRTSPSSGLAAQPATGVGVELHPQGRTGGRDRGQVAVAGGGGDLDGVAGAAGGSGGPAVGLFGVVAGLAEALAVVGAGRAALGVVLGRGRGGGSGRCTKGCGSVGRGAGGSRPGGRRTGGRC